MMDANARPELPQPPKRRASAAGNHGAVGRYRKRNRRIDYYPSGEALAAIEAAMAAGLSNCLAGVVDALILAGHRAEISGKAPG